MNARHFFSRSKALAATALLAVAGVANAGGVSWSVGVNAPIIHGPGHVNAVVSGGPGYSGYYYPPQPVYVQPRVIVAQPYYGVQPVIYQAPPRLRGNHGWNSRWHRHGHVESHGHGPRHGHGHGHGRDHGRGHGHDGHRGGGWSHHGR